MYLQYKSLGAVAHPLFGKGIAIDIGASNGGSLKLQETDNDGNPTGYHQRYQMEPFSSEQDFVRKIVHKVDSFNPSHEPYERIVVFAPGLPAKQKPGVFLAFSNLMRNGARQPTSENILKNIDFNPLREALGNGKTKLVTLSDVVGGCTRAIATGLKQYPARFQTGEKITFAVTGGGLGMVNADMKKNAVHIKMSESGTVLDSTRNQQVLELSRASVTALTENFVRALKKLPQHKLSKVKQKISQLNTAKLPGTIVTSHAEAARVIPFLTQKRHDRAAAAAISDYIEGLSTAYHMKVNEGTTLAILAGPVVQGVKQYLEENPKPFQKEIHAHDQEFPDRQERPVLEKILLHRLYNKLSFAKKLFLKDNLDVITDIGIADNTVGAKYVLQGEAGSHPYHFNIPLSAFDD